MSEQLVTLEVVQGGQRVDKYLAEQGGVFISRSFVQGLIEQRRVRVNGEVCARPSVKLAAGDLVEADIPPPPPPEPLAQNIPLDIVYEDDHLIVVNKPRGMVVHPAPGNEDGTLVNALLAHCNLAGVGSAARPGIVHRLDKGTSGLLVAAKEPQTYMGLIVQLKERTVSRHYLAFVHGSVPDARWTVDAPIARDPNHRQKMAVIAHGKPAVTHFECIERLGEYSSIRAQLVTGRTHQIRVHMAHIGHPLIGDRRYGAPSEPALPDEGVALHAAYLEFTHPRTGKALSFEAQLPNDLQELWTRLGGHVSGA